MDNCLISPNKNIKLEEWQYRAAKYMLEHRGLITAFGTGTGKTITSVAVINCFLKSNPDGKIIFISPLSLKANIVKELSKFNLSIDKEPLKSKLQLFSFSSFQKKMESKEPVDCSNTLLIVDEAHTLRTQIKLNKSKVDGWVAIHTLGCAAKAAKVLLLTATPVYNSPMDIINLIAMIDGKRFPISYETFKNKGTDFFNSSEFKNFIKCRITFHSVGENEFFPRKKEVIKEFIMSPQYYKKYNEIEEKVADENTAQAFGDPSKFSFFYHALRRAVNDIDNEETSPKVKWIVEQIAEQVSKGNKSVIFSNWINSGIVPVMKKLDEQKIKFGFISGDVQEKVREEIKLDYNKGLVKVLFISSAGGEGLDLTETSNVYIMESNWNVNKENQIIGRAVRFKSHINLPPEKQIVNIYRLVMKKPPNRLPHDDNPLTVDEILYKFSHNKKQPLLDEVTDIMKSVAIENQDCRTIPSNNRYYDDKSKLNTSIDTILKNKIEESEKIKKQKKEGKKEEEDKKEEEKKKEERQKKISTQKKEMVKKYNQEFIAKEKATRLKYKLEKQKQEEKKDEKKEERKKEEKTEEDKNTLACYKLLVDNYVWSFDKNEFIQNYKDYSSKLASISQGSPNYDDRMRQVKILQMCRDDLADVDVFYKKVLETSKILYPLELKRDIYKVLDEGLNKQDFTLEGRTLGGDYKIFLRLLDDYYLAKSTIPKARLYVSAITVLWYEENVKKLLGIKQRMRIEEDIQTRKYERVKKSSEIKKNLLEKIQRLSSDIDREKREKREGRERIERIEDGEQKKEGLVSRLTKLYEQKLEEPYKKKEEEREEEREEEEREEEEKEEEEKEEEREEEEEEEEEEEQKEEEQKEEKEESEEEKRERQKLKIIKYLNKFLKEGKIDLEITTLREARILIRNKIGKIDKKFVNSVIREWFFSLSQREEEKREEEEREEEPKKIKGGDEVKDEVVCEVYNVVFTLSKIFQYSYDNNIPIKILSDNDIIYFLKEFSENKDCKDEDYAYSLQTIRVIIDEINNENEDGEFNYALKMFFSDLKYNAKIIPYIPTVSSFKRVIKGFIENPLYSNEDKLKEMYNYLINELIYYSAYIHISKIVHENPDILGKGYLENIRNELTELYDIYTKANKDDVKDIIIEIVSILKSSEYEELIKSGVLSIIMQLTEEEEVQDKKELIEYLQVIFPNQSEDNIKKLISHYEEVSNVKVPSEEEEEEKESEEVEEDGEEGEEEGEEEDKQKEEKEEEELTREQIIEKWKQMYKDIEEKEGMTKLKMFVCKAYNIELLLSKLFLYSFLNDKRVSDVDKKDFVDFVLTLDDFKDCERSEVENNYVYVESIWANTIEFEEPDSRFINAMGMFFTHLRYETEYKYILDIKSYSKFYNIIEKFIEDPLLSRTDILKDIYTKVITYLFYFYMLDDIISLTIENPSIIFEQDDEDDIIKEIREELDTKKSYASVLKSDKDKYINEIKRIIKLISSEDIDAIRTKEVFSILQKALDKGTKEDDFVNYMSNIFLNQSNDNLQSVVDMFLSSIEKEEPVLKCNIDELTIGAQLMKIAYVDNVNISDSNNEYLLKKLKDTFEETNTCTDEEILSLIEEPRNILSISNYKEYVTNMDTLSEMANVSHLLYNTFDKIDSMHTLLERVLLLFKKVKSKEDLYFISRNITHKIPDMKNIILFDYRNTYTSKNEVVDIIEPLIMHKMEKLAISKNDNFLVYYNDTPSQISKFILDTKRALNFVLFSSIFPQYLKVYNYDIVSKVCETEVLNLNEWSEIDVFKFDNKSKEHFEAILLMILLTCYEQETFISFSDLKSCILIKRGEHIFHTFEICGNKYTLKSDIHIKILPYSFSPVVCPLLSVYEHMDIGFLNKTLSMSIKKEEDFYSLCNIRIETLLKNLRDVSISLKEECKDVAVNDFSTDVTTRFSEDNEVSKLRSLIDDKSVPLMFGYNCIKYMNMNFYKNLTFIYLSLRKSAPSYIKHNMYSSLYHRLETQLSGVKYVYSVNFELLLPCVASYSIKDKTVLSKLQRNVTDKREELSSKSIIIDYIPPASFMQIYLVKNNKNFYNMVKSVLRKSVSRDAVEELEQLIKENIQNYKNDMYFYENLKEFVNEHMNEIPEQEVDLIRASSKYNAVKVVLNRFGKDSKILDFGGGNGAILSYFANKMNLEPTNAISLDVETWQGNIHGKEYDNITYKVIKSGESIGFARNTFDIITCFQVLHHIDISNLNQTLESLSSCLKKGGVLILREHDCENLETSLLIDIEHTLYETVANGKDKMNGSQLCDYKDGLNYKPISEWIRLLSTYSLVEMKKENYNRAYEVKGETRYTYRFFQKI